MMIGFRTVLDQTGTYIFIKDTAGCYTYVNKMTQDLFGLKLEEIVGLDDSHFFDLTHATELLTNDRLVMDLGETIEREETNIIKATGETRIYWTVKKPLCNDHGQIIGLCGISTDITERKMMENTLCEVEIQKSKSLSLLQATLDSTNDAILVVDLNNTWVLHNERFLKLWQITDEILTAKDDNAALTSVLNQLEDADAFLKKVIELYATPEKSSFDIVKFKNGKIIERYSIPQLIDDKVVGRVWSFRDVTDRKQTEQKIKIESEKSQALLRNASDGIHILDYDGNIIEASESFCDMLGYRRDEVIGMNVSQWDAGFANSDEQLKEVRKQFEKPVRSQFESKHKRKDGSIFEVEISGYPLVLAGQKVLFNASRDITDRKLITRQIQESEERLRLALLAGNQGWFDLNVQTGEIAVSPEYVHMIGYDPNNFHTNFNEWKNSIHPDDLDAVETVFKECLATNSQKAMQYRRITAKGRWKWIYSVGKVTEWDADNHPLRMIGTHTDITLQKNTELELLIAKAKAEKANNAKSRFLAAASHDLRQPLTALSLYVEMLTRQAPPDDSGLGAKIQDCVNSLSELLNDMLDVSKLDAGVVTPNLSDVPINDLLQSMITIHSLEAELKGLHLRVRPSTEIVRIDPQLMQRIVGNLVFNAIRYTNKGGILVGCRRHQGKFWIEVWDTGIGIHKGELDYIFGEFTQLGDGARNRGSGLGLAIVDKTAKLLGLQVRVRSRLGQGSMFAIEVPLGYAMPTELLTVIEQPSMRLTIAVVDDNLSVLEAFFSAMNAYGHEVISATSGRELFKLLGSRMPDILISDYRLADGETGLDLIVAARRLFTDNLPAILITGDTDPELLQAMAKQDITVCHKPLKMSDLDIIIRETVERNLNT